MNATTERFEAWAIVELFGHQKIAGRVTEQSIGGCHFLRVDVPDVNGRPGFTKLYTQGAIYGVTFVDETVATMAAASMRLEPVKAYDLEAIKINAVRDRLAHGYGEEV